MIASQSLGLALTGVSGRALFIFCAPASMVLKLSMDTGTVCGSIGKLERSFLTEHIRGSHVKGEIQ